MANMEWYIEWCNENAGFVMAALTSLYVLATVWLVGLGRSQLRQATTLERSRTRPFVLFDLFLEKGCVFAQLSNTGQTAALNV